MKKLLLLFIFTCAFSSQAQNLILTENCESLTIGNVGTDLTGTTAGQGNWYIYTPTTAVPAGTVLDYQVVTNTVSSSKVLQVTGTSGSAGSRFLSQDVSTAWTNRTSGNDIIQLEYDFFTGSGVTTSLNTFRTYIYNTDGIAVAGYFFEPATLKLSGWAYYDNAGTAGYYTFNLITGGLFLTANTWYKLGVAYDYNTGDISWKDNGGLFYTGVLSAATSVDVAEFDFAVASGTTATLTNAASNQFLVDNVKATLVAVEALLDVDTNTISSNEFSLYPNPTKGLVSISNSSALINSIEITDLNGRVVKSITDASNLNVEVNISDLSSGVYMMKIVSEKGTITKKVIKE